MSKLCISTLHGDDDAELNAERFIALTVCISVSDLTSNNVYKDDTKYYRTKKAIRGKIIKSLLGF